MTSRDCCHFLPPYLLERVQPHMVEHDQALRARRASGPLTPQTVAGSAAWGVHTCHNTSQLPGDLVRSAGDPASGDAAVDEAATGITASLAMYAEVYDRDSFDGRGAPVSLSVHYEQGYDNAYWDGTQLVFGDGDGQIFDRFTKPMDVLGHEFTHAVTERTAGLTYSGQSGALNESISDVFGSCVKQRWLGQSVAQADWLIGAGLFLPGVRGRALRDMANPGTAYDDPRLGKDPQAADMSGYVDTTDDNGGVHTNSGIPNRAFYLAATAIGGSSWEGAGAIWYAALTSGIGADTDFAGYAAATVAAAGQHADAVTTAWKTVGVEPS
jgi:Zn-dependent metalloprotease